MAIPIHKPWLLGKHDGPWEDLLKKGPLIALTHREAEIAIKAIYTVKRAVSASAIDESLRSEGDDELQTELEDFYENADV